MRGREPQPVEPRFWAKVDVRGRDECWPWLGVLTVRDVGYGRIKVNGEFRMAHVVSWELHHRRPFPEGKSATHKCDNPWCVNPHHIRPATHRENMLESKERGRNYRPPRKTHCINGHRYTLANTYFDGLNKRHCRICRDAARERAR